VSSALAEKVRRDEHLAHLRAAIGDFVRRPPASAITSPCRSSEPAGSPTAATSEQLAQGELTEGSSIPFSIVDATQFFEFAGRIAEDATDGDTVRLPPVLFQRMAADDVATAVGRVAAGRPAQPASGRRPPRPSQGCRRSRCPLVRRQARGAPHCGGDAAVVGERPTAASSAHHVIDPCSAAPRPTGSFGGSSAAGRVDACTARTRVACGTPAASWRGRGGR
jgi:hypothetical protein